MINHQAKGRRMTRPDRCPYGWMPHLVDTGRLIEHSEEQEAIARIRESRQRGGSMREIARMLNRAGTDCRGKPWTHSAVRSILRRSGQLAEAF